MTELNFLCVDLHLMRFQLIHEDFPPPLLPLISGDGIVVESESDFLDVFVVVFRLHQRTRIHRIHLNIVKCHI